MHYLLFICSDGAPTEEKARVMSSEVPTWVADTEERGIRRFGNELAPVSEAVTVRVRDGQTVVTDGPFAESKEFVAGFDVIDAADLDEALAVAAAHPVSWFHAIEVRPFAGDPPQPSPAREATDLTPTAEGVGEPAPGRRRYLLLMCVDGIPASDEEEAALRRGGQSWLERAEASGAPVCGHALEHAETASTVRVRGGETLVSDGPFVEAKEFIGGFAIVECASREEAIALAAAHPLARHHLIEVRPFAE